MPLAREYLQYRSRKRNRSINPTMPGRKGRSLRGRHGSYTLVPAEHSLPRFMTLARMFEMLYVVNLVIESLHWDGSAS